MAVQDDRREREMCRRFSDRMIDVIQSDVVEVAAAAEKNIRDIANIFARSLISKDST